VFFIGKVNREALPHIYSAADVFLFPSTTDTFGMVVLEAQACGVPAIVTDEGGPKDIVIQEETGYILPISSTHEWVTTIEKLLSLRNSSHWLSLRERAISNVEKRFQWKAVFGSIFSSPKELLESSPQE